MDRSASDSDHWVPSLCAGGIQARPYQDQLAGEAERGNRIVHLPTGMGKTHIAVLLIQRLQKRYGLTRHCGADTRKIVFVTPATQLAQQQMDVLQTNLDLSVGVYSGDLDKEYSSAVFWRKELAQHQVLVMTGQLLLNALVGGHVTMGQLLLLVLDECHHATSDHPYAHIMRSHYHQADPLNRPRILGLTASPTKRRLSDHPDAVRQEVDLLESVLVSTMVSASGSDLGPYLTSPDLSIIEYDHPLVGFGPALIDLGVPDFGGAYREGLDMFDRGLRDLGGSTASYRQVLSCRWALRDMGIWPALYVIMQTLAASETPRATIDQDWLLAEAYLLQVAAILARPIVETAQAQKATHPLLMAYLSDDAVPGLRVLKVLLDSTDLHLEMHVTPKVQGFVQLLQEHSSRGGFSCIVFAERQVAVDALFMLLQVPAVGLSHIQCERFVGQSPTWHGAVPKPRPKTVLDGFREGSCQVLIATDAAEEGLDIQHCGVVILFDMIQTTKNFIQRSGRARRGGKLLILVEKDNMEHLGLIKRAREEIDAVSELVKNRQGPDTPLPSTINVSQSPSPPPSLPAIVATQGPSQSETETDLPDLVTDLGKRLSRSNAAQVLNDYMQMAFGLTAGKSLSHNERRRHKTIEYQAVLYIPIYSDVTARPPARPTVQTVYAGFMERLAPVDGWREDTARLRVLSRFGQSKKSTEKEAQLLACMWLYMMGELDGNLASTRRLKRPASTPISGRAKKPTPESSPLASSSTDLTAAQSKTAVGDEPMLIDFSGSPAHTVPEADSEAPGVGVDGRKVPEVMTARYERLGQAYRVYVYVAVIGCYDARQTATVKKGYGVCLAQAASTAGLGAFDILVADNKATTVTMAPMVEMVLSLSQLADLRAFHILLYNTLEHWMGPKGYKRPLGEDWAENDTRTCFVAPVLYSKQEEEGGVDDVRIDWEGVMDFLKFHRASEYIGPPLSSYLEATHTDYVVHPSYDRKMFYYVRGKEANLTLGSPFVDPTKADTYLDYFKRKTQSFEGDPSEALLRVSHIPHYVDATRNQHAEEGSFVHLPPGVCRVHALSRSLWDQARSMPIILWRLEYSLAACELRDSIGVDVPMPLFLEALTAPSFQDSDFSYERLEYLGDSILKYISARHLYIQSPTADEGYLSEALHDLVANQTLAKHARKKGMQGYICLDKWNRAADNWRVPGFGKRDRKDRINNKTVADVVEALLAACFLSGQTAAERFDNAYKWMAYLGVNLDRGPLPPLEDYEVPHYWRRKQEEANRLQELIGYRFKNPNLLLQAVTHASVQERPNYQRLEFMGDVVVELCVSFYMHQTYRTLGPGHLTTLRSEAVNNSIMAIYSTALGMPEVMAMTSAEKEQEIRVFVRHYAQRSLDSGAVERAPKQLSDLFESLIGAVLHDSEDLRTTECVVQHCMHAALTQLCVPERVPSSPSSHLAAWCSARGLPAPDIRYVYSADEEEVTCSITINGKLYGTHTAPTEIGALYKAAQWVFKSAGEGYNFYPEISPPSPESAVRLSYILD